MTIGTLISMHLLYGHVNHLLFLKSTCLKLVAEIHWNLFDSKAKAAQTSANQIFQLVSSDSINILTSPYLWIDLKVLATVIIVFDKSKISHKAGAYFERALYPMKLSYPMRTVKAGGNRHTDLPSDTSQDFSPPPPCTPGTKLCH